MDFVRFHAPHANARGTFPGVFALANGLRADGLLSDSDAAWLLNANARATAAYADPSVTHPDVYDREINPAAEAWFRTTATHLIDMARDYVALLGRHSVECVETHSDGPGRVLYSDDVQIVVVPHSAS